MLEEASFELAVPARRVDAGVGGIEEIGKVSTVDVSTRCKTRCCGETFGSVAGNDSGTSNGDVGSEVESPGSARMGIGLHVVGIWNLLEFQVMKSCPSTMPLASKSP